MRANHLFALIFVCACTDTTNQSDREIAAEEGDVDSDECKLEGDAIGEQTVIDLGSKSVRVHDWVGKTGSPGEYVGFSVTIGGGDAVTYKVKAAGEVYPSDTLTWMHPNGPDGGSGSPGISNIDFCDDCDNPDGCEGGGGDDGGGDDDGDGCDNPDGCEPPPPPPPTDPVLM
jgi:hypothetical protein